MAYKERRIEAQSVCAAITDWTTVQMDLREHAGKYLRRIMIHNRNSASVQDRTSVAHAFIRRKAQGVDTIFDTLIDNNLFGYYEGLTWEGSVYIDDALDLWVRYVAYAIGDVISIEAIISEFPGSNYAMPKPRDRLIQISSSQGSGAGGTVTVTLTVPVGRRWRIKGTMTMIDEAAKDLVTCLQNASAAYIQTLVRISSSTSGVRYQYPHILGAYASTESSGAEAMLMERNLLKFIANSLSASKTLTYAYTIVEEPDSQIPAPT